MNMLLFPNGERAQTCQICGKEKPLSDFPLTSPTTHSRICTPCQGKTVKTWQKTNAPNSPSVSCPIRKHFSIDYYFGQHQNTQKNHFHTTKPHSKPLIKELFENASRAWKKFINPEDDEDEGGSGGKGKRASVDFYALRLANLNQLDNYHKITRASKDARVNFSHRQSTLTKDNQRKSDKRARKASGI